MQQPSQRNDPALPSPLLGWTIWGLGAGFYLFAFFQRVAPGVITSELSLDFGLSAAALGHFSAFYFYSYVAMQIPTGILADIWGPRRLLTAGAAVAGLGCLLFAVSDSFQIAAIGRLLIGGSVAVAFICILKLAVHWLDPRQFALASGMALFIGIVGAVFAGVPLRLMVEAFGWRMVMGASALFPLIIAIAIWFFVRDDPKEKGYASYTTHEAPDDLNPWSHAFTGLVRVFKYRNTWLLSLVPGGIVGSILSFAGLWGVPFLTTHHGMAKTNAAALCSAMLIAWALGGPVFGSLSDRLHRRRSLYIAGCSVVAAGWCLITIIPAMPQTLLSSLLLVIGFSSGCMVLGFAFAKDSVPGPLAGTVSGVVNMGVMMGPMILQPAVGLMLDINWNGQSENGIKVYDISAYQSGFMLMALWATASFILILASKEAKHAG